MPRPIPLLLCLALLGPIAQLPAPHGPSARAAVPDTLKPTLDQARAAIKNLRTNLNLAQEAAGAGTAPLAGSKARLVQLRLSQALAYVEPLNQALAALPADDADVKLIQSDFDTAQAEIKTLQDRLASPSSPAQPPAAPPSATPSSPPASTGAPAPAPAKLDYRQAEQVKNANFHLREVEGNIAALKQAIAAFSQVANKDLVDHRKLNDSVATIANARRKSGFANDALAGLPDNGAGVADARARLVKAGEEIALAESEINPLHARVQQVIDPSGYPAFEDDLKRLAGLAAMFADTTIFQIRRPFAAGVIREVEPAKVEAQRISDAYAVLVAQQTEQGRRVDGASKHFADKVSGFMAECDNQRAALPEQITKDMNEASTMADEAVAAKRPAWFVGGIPQRVEQIDEKVQVLEVLDPAKGSEARARLTALKAEFAQKSKALEELIIQQNTPPRDAYAGPDKAELVRLADEAWRSTEPGATILAAFIPSEAWARETSWRLENRTWRFSDRSRLQVILLVKRDDRLATIRPINLSINHQSGDARSAEPLDNLTDALPPQRFLLIEKIK